MRLFSSFFLRGIITHYYYAIKKVLIATLRAANILYGIQRRDNLGVAYVQSMLKWVKFSEGCTFYISNSYYSRLTPDFGRNNCYWGYTRRVQLDRDILMRIGSALRARRLQHGLTQRTLSQLSKIDRNYISDVERGKRNPSILTLCELLHQLDTDIVSFISSLKQ